MSCFSWEHFDDFIFFLRNKQRLLSLREAHQEIFCRGSDEESHSDNIEESWLFADREGSPRDVDGAALQDVRHAATPVPDDLHLEADLNVREGDQAAGYDVVDGHMELMWANNVHAQGILFENEEGSKCDLKDFYFLVFFVFFVFLPWPLQ